MGAIPALWQGWVGGLCDAADDWGVILFFTAFGEVSTANPRLKYGVRVVKIRKIKKNCG